jgi:hypothetical protein
MAIVRVEVGREAAHSMLSWLKVKEAPNFLLLALEPEEPRDLCSVIKQFERHFFFDKLVSKKLTYLYIGVDGHCSDDDSVEA